MVDEKKIRANVLSIYDAINRRDIQAVVSHWAEGATLYIPGKGDEKIIFTGKKAMHEHYQELLDAFPEVKLSVINMGVDEKEGGISVALAEWVLDGTNSEGKSVNAMGISVIDYKDDLIVEVRDYFTTPAP